MLCSGTRHISGDVTHECVPACMCWCVEFHPIRWPHSKAFREWGGWIWLLDGRMMRPISPQPQTHLLCTLAHTHCQYCRTKHASKRNPTYIQRELETSQNRAGEEVREKKTWNEETFRGPKFQRYHYLSISIGEIHLAGLGSHSQWAPEVKGAVVVGCRQPGDEDEEERLCTCSAFLHNKGTLLVSGD